MGLDSALGSVVGAVPAGVVVPFAGSTSPSGWLLCHGQAVSRTDYGALFSAVGTTYGSGDGSTTFNLPDLRGRVVAGLDNMGGSAASRLTSTTITGGADGLGEVGGSQSVSHTHTGTGSLKAAIGASANDINSLSYIADTVPSGAPTTVAAYSFTGLSATTTSRTFNHYTPVYGSTGAASDEGNVQPTMVLNYIIKASAY